VGSEGAASLAYVGPVATAFAYWAVVHAGRQVRPSSISMALLATPCLGIVVSALALGEPIEPSLAAGAILIGAGIWLAATGSSRRRAQIAQLRNPQNTSSRSGR
jgi:drug/metabolite transporter (DMT)-like permease